MRIQIVDDDGNVIHKPVLNQFFERDLREAFGTVPRWRVFRRAAHNHALREIERVTAELRHLTRF